MPSIHSWCNQITDEGIKYLGNLHTLDLHSCNLISELNFMIEIVQNLKQ